jgi:precorrin-6B methylase 1
MSKKLKTTESRILELHKWKEKKQQKQIEGLSNHIWFVDDKDTPESIETSIVSLNKEREFELERKNRLWYNQEWFKMLVTSVVTVVATLLAAK